MFPHPSSAIVALAWCLVIAAKISSIPPLVTTATLTSSLPDSAFTRLRACFTIPCKKNFHNIFVFVWGDIKFPSSLEK
jgi:hypothetical protein